MIHVIYMAAGNSRRFGSNKLLYLYEGKPLYRHGLELLLKLKQEMGEKLTVTVVTQYAEILEEVQDIFERCGMAGMQAVFCEESRLGASYTIRAGIEAVISQDPIKKLPPFQWQLSFLLFREHKHAPCAFTHSRVCAKQKRRLPSYKVIGEKDCCYCQQVP